MIFYQTNLIFKFKSYFFFYLVYRCLYIYIYIYIYIYKLQICSIQIDLGTCLNGAYMIFAYIKTLDNVHKASLLVA